jgi:NAD(P)H-dependent FMN reductase
MGEPARFLFCGNLARLAAAALRAHGAEVSLGELKDYPMPIYEGDLEVTGGQPSKAKEFKELVRNHDALVIASPEHNGSFSALLKNTIDWISRAEPGERSLAVLRGKTAALIAGSPGSRGGQRAHRRTP